MIGDNEWVESEKPRVNFSILTSDSRFVNKIVTLLGKVKEVDSTGTKVTIETSDRQTVTVRFTRPIDQQIGSYVEIYGRVQRGGRELDGLGFTAFSEELTKKFDMEQYNKSVELFHKFVQNSSMCMAD